VIPNDDETGGLEKQLPGAQKGEAPPKGLMRQRLLKVFDMKGHMAAFIVQDLR
jgi:hypothetical protein